MATNNLLPEEVAAFLRDEVECSIDGRRCDLTLTFAAVSQDLNGSFPAAPGELTYNRARAKRLFDQHREALNDAWRELFG